MHNVALKARYLAMEQFGTINGVTVQVDFEKPLTQTEVNKMKKGILNCSYQASYELSEVVKITKNYIILKFQEFTSIDNMLRLIEVLKPEKKSPYPSNFVFDEDKSVRWNREQVEEYNENIKKEVLEFSKYKNMVYDMIKMFIINECKYGKLKNAPNSVMEKIWEKAYEDGHSAGYSEVKNYMEEYVDMVNDVLELMDKQ